MRGRDSSGVWAERGVALVVTMMATLVIVGMAAAVIPLTTTETAVVFNHRRSLQMLYAAEAALEWGTYELATVRWDDALRGRARFSFWGGATIVRLVDGTTIDLGDMTKSGWAGPRSESPDRRWQLVGFGPFSELVPGRISTPGIIVAVWIADDPDDPDGDPLRDANAVIELRAAAVGSAHTLRAIRASVHRQPGGHVWVSQWQVVR